MAYIEKVTIAGKVKEVEKYFSSRYGKKNIPRGENIKPSAEAVKKVNDRQAAAKLRGLINTNFGYKDIHLVLTYKEILRPSPEQAKIHLAKFMRDLRKLYKKKGKVLKYISVTEFKNKAIHHHLIINKLDDLSELMDIWPYGQPRPTYLYDTGEYAKLASYLIKETSKTFNSDEKIYAKRWNSSRNLKKPKITKHVIHMRSWRKDPKDTKDWIVDKNSVENWFDEFTQTQHQFYSMIRRE